MNDVFIGKGRLAGKAIYAARDFRKGEVVIRYQLKLLTRQEVEELPEHERQFIHIHWGKRYLYSVPERYVNHSLSPNTYADLKLQCDIALCDIKKGEMITTDANFDDVG